MNDIGWLWLNLQQSVLATIDSSRTVFPTKQGRYNFEHCWGNVRCRPRRPDISTEAYLRVRKALLEREGYSVLAATTSAEALKLFREAAVSLVLSDHMLRGTTGVALAQQLKAMKPHVPFVLVRRIPPTTLAAN